MRVQDEGTWPNRLSMLTRFVMVDLWGNECIDWQEI